MTTLVSFNSEKNIAHAIKLGFIDLPFKNVTTDANDVIYIMPNGGIAEKYKGNIVTIISEITEITQVSSEEVKNAKWPDYNEFKEQTRIYFNKKCMSCISYKDIPKVILKYKKGQSGINRF